MGRVAITPRPTKEETHLVAVVEAVAPPVQPERIETVQEVQAEIIRVFGSHAPQALCIARNESGFVPSKIGYNTDRLRTHDRGVFQLNSYWHREVSDAEAFDAKANIAAAYRISQGGTNWNSWATRPKCL